MNNDWQPQAHALLGKGLDGAGIDRRGGEAGAERALQGAALNVCVQRGQLRPHLRAGGVRAVGGMVGSKGMAVAWFR